MMLYSGRTCRVPGDLCPVQDNPIMCHRQCDRSILEDVDFRRPCSFHGHTCSHTWKDICENIFSAYARTYSAFKHTVALTEEVQIWHVQMTHVNLNLHSDLVTHINVSCFLYVLFCFVFFSFLRCSWKFFLLFNTVLLLTRHVIL